MSRINDIWLRKPAGLAWGVDFSGGRTSSPNGINATLAGDAVVTAGNRYLTLDGAGDWMTSDDAASLDVGEAFSVSVWVNPSTPGTSVTRVPISRYHAAVNKRSWVISLRYADSPQRVYGVVGGGTTAGIVYAFNQTLPTSGWHHYAMTYNKAASAGARVAMYSDGSAMTLSTVLWDIAETPFVTDIGIRMGNDGDGSATAWKGNLGPAAVFNRVMSSGEIAQLYNAGAARIALGGTP